MQSEREQVRSVAVFTLAPGVHLEVRTEGERVVVLIALPKGGCLMPRWGLA